MVVRRASLEECREHCDYAPYFSYWDEGKEKARWCACKDSKIWAQTSKSWGAYKTGKSIAGCGKEPAWGCELRGGVVIPEKYRVDRKYAIDRARDCRHHCKGLNAPYFTRGYTTKSGYLSGRNKIPYCDCFESKEGAQFRTSELFIRSGRAIGC